MAQCNYFLINRSLKNHPLWLSEPFTRGQAWVDMIMLANFCDAWILVRGVKVEVKRGQLGWSETKLSERWGWSRSKLRAFFKLLENDQQIEQQKNNVTTLITIINYETYQQKEQQTEQQKDSRKTAERQQKDTNKEESKEEELKNVCQLPLTAPENEVEKPPTPPKRKNGRPKKPPSPESQPHRTFVNWWLFAYSQVTGNKYLFTDKDGNLVKKMLAGCENNLTKMVVAGANLLTSEDEWYDRTGRTLGTMFNQFNKLQQIKSDFSAAREYGIVPPAGVLFVDWDWNQQEASNG
jgi:hypothetical protein